MDNKKVRNKIHHHLAFKLIRINKITPVNKAD